MWSAPYTLDNVPIIGYNINDDQEILLDTVNTTEYILEACTLTAVYVSGVNGAGIGDSNNVIFNIARGIYTYIHILCYKWRHHFLLNFSSTNSSSLSCSNNNRRHAFISSVYQC